MTAAAKDVTLPSPLATAMERLTADFRTFVAGLQKKDPTDKSWMDTARAKCLELSAQLSEIQSRWGDRRHAFAGMMEQTRASLLTAAGELAQNIRETPNAQKLRTLQATMVRRYEDFVAGLKNTPLWTRTDRPKVRSLRVPRVTRSLVHIALGTTAVLLYELLLTKTLALTLLFSFLAVFVGLEISRRFSSRFNDFMVDTLFGLISRPQERYRINSATYYLLAMTLVATVLPKTAACAGVLMLAFGDPLASMAGSRLGRLRLFYDKSLVGSLTFLTVTTSVVFIYFLLFATGYTPLEMLGIASLVALVGTVVELISQHIDDNLTIPLACSLFLVIWF